MNFEAIDACTLPCKKMMARFNFQDGWMGRMLYVVPRTYYCTASGLRQVMDEFNALLDYLREFTNKRLSSLKVVTWMKLVMIMSPYIHTVHK